MMTFPCKKDDAVWCRWLLFCLPLLLVGCATPEVGQRQVYTPPANAGVTTAPSNNLAPLTPQALTPTSPSQTPLVYPRSIEDSNASPAVVALYQQAQKSQQAGKFNAAGDALQRALNLAPRNAFLWSAMARLHLRQQQWDQAEAEASKSNSLAGGNVYLEADNWRMIAAARQAQGNAQGALQAQTQAAQLMQGQSGSQ